MHNKIIVVGAGAAGLAAAQQLIQTGYSVQVLEASDRMGGRVHHVCIGDDTVIDVGASLLHNKHTSMYQFAKDQGYIATSRPKMRYLLGDKSYSSLSLIVKLGMSGLYRIGRLYKAFNHYEGSERTIQQLLDDVKLRASAQQLLTTTLSSSLAASLDDIGVRALRHSLRTAGVRPEYDLIAQPLKVPMTQLLRPYREIVEPYVHYGAEATHIEWGETGVTVGTSSGDTYVGDCVIIGVSLGVLKKERIKFDPPLPAEKQVAIKSLGMGQGYKVVLRFAHRFWPTGCHFLVNSDANVTFLILPITRESYSLVAYVIDDDAELRADQHCVDTAITALENWFGGSQAVRGELLEYYVQNWSADPNYSGLYSYDALGSEGARDVLAKPVEHRLFFAGEASVNGYAGSVDGAILSGQRAVQQIISI